jgi:alpha-D-xyloside xylohydrolase
MAKAKSATKKVSASVRRPAGKATARGKSAAKAKAVAAKPKSKPAPEHKSAKTPAAKPAPVKVAPPSPPPAKPSAQPKSSATYDGDSYSLRFQSEKTFIYQDDTRIFFRTGCEYDTVVELESCKCSGGEFSATAKLASGKTASFAIINVAEDIVRMRLWKGRVAFEEESEMLVNQPAPRSGMSMVEQDGRCLLSIGTHTVQITKKPFGLAVLNREQTCVMELESEKIAGKHVAPPLGFRIAGGAEQPYMSWRIHNTDRFFGLGEKWNKVEKTSTRATVWSCDTCGSNTTDMSYKSQPVLFCTGGWGAMLHSSFRSVWEVGTFSYTAGSVLTEDPKLDLFLYFGPDLKVLLGKHTDTTGKPGMPPLWALGVWMSRCAYKTRQEVEEVQSRLRSEKIPCDVVSVDPLWMKVHYYYKIGVDACDFDWNNESFPNHREFFANARKNGFSTCLWINPYLPAGTAIFDEAAKSGYLLKTPSGDVATIGSKPGAGMVDFSNPQARQWWKDHLKQLLNDGAAVFKPDYGDAVPEDTVFHNGKTGREMHNRYLFLFAETAFDAAKEVHGQGMVWRRAGYIGSQRHPGTWAGDTQVT